MFCKYCGAEVEEGAKFCSFCGNSLEEKKEKKDEVLNDVMTEDVETIEAKSEDSPAKVWKIFAKISKILGIVSIATFFIPLVSFVTTGVVGVVLGVLGGRAKDKEADDWRKIGINLSIIGAALSFVFYIIAQ